MPSTSALQLEKDSGADNANRNKEAVRRSSSNSDESNYGTPASSTSPPSPSPSASSSQSSSKRSNETRQSKNSPRRIQPSLSLSSLPTVSSTAGLFLGSSEHLSSYTTTARVIEALTKFQTCLFLLTSTIVRLQETLKSIIPIGSGAQSGLEGSREAATPSTTEDLPEEMVQTSLCPRLGKKFRHSGFGKNGPDDDNGKKKPDIVLNVSPGPETSSNAPEKSLDEKQTTKSVLLKCSSLIVNYAGIILSLFTSFCMSIIALVVKYMDGYHPVSKVIWRLQGVLFPSLVILLYVRYYQKKPLILWREDGSDTGLKRPVHWKWQILLLLVIRGIVGCSADIFQYYSLKSLPLADSTVIVSSTPIMVCIIAHFVLQEKWGIVPIFTALLTLCGVIVICKPPILTGAEAMSTTVLVGNILAAACMICNTFATVIMRYLQHIHFAVTMLALGIFGTIEGFIVSLFTGPSPMELPTQNYVIDLMLAVLIAGLFFFGQLSMTLALQYEEAGVVSLVRTCDVLFAFIWQVNFLRQDANIFSYIGALIVTLGVIITAIRRWVGDLPEHCPIRKRLSFILR